MAHYIHDDLNNRIEGLSKEEIYALIDEVIASGELPTDAQTAFVTALKSIVNGNPYKIGFCTTAEYNELEAQGELQEDALYIITDDNSYYDLITYVDTKIQELKDNEIANLQGRVTVLENEKLYQHNIYLRASLYKYTDAPYDWSSYCDITMQITNNSPTPINSISMLQNFLTQNDFTTAYKRLLATGYIDEFNNNNYYKYPTALGIYYDSTKAHIIGNYITGSYNREYQINTTVTMNDIVIELM